jgi:hypothetical protein
MKVEVEVYGERIGDEGLARLISHKEGRVLFTIQDDEKKTQFKFILSRREAFDMVDQMKKQIEHAEVNGFTVI